MVRTSERARLRRAELVLFSTAALAFGCSGGSNAATTKKCRDAKQPSALTTATSARLLLTQTVVSKLQTRAQANDAAWAALEQKCNGYTTGTVYPPNGNAYPNSNSIGQGYQGDGYLSAIATLGLCYRTVKGVDDVAAAKYAATGSDVLVAMATPSGSGGAKPSTDSGYGIRNYGVGMALGYDWLSPDLSASVKQQVITALDTWIDWYDQSGFTKNDPIANYFVGYFLAKTYTAIATEGDNAKAGTYWNDVETKLWGQLVKPRYASYMQGGGWPEGWQYGPRAVRGIAEALWAAKTGKSLDWYAELPQVREQAEYLNYFVWPSLGRMDDQGTVRSGSQLGPSAALYTSLATISSELGDADAPIAKAVAADVLAAGKDDREPWQKFLYWDPTQPQASYKTRPLSYEAPGPGHVAMRSSWDNSAVWCALSAGRYIDAPASGEEMFNAGSFSIVSGADPVLVNATGWMPQTAGTPGEDFVYNDSWGGGGRRLYNTLLVDNPSGSISPGQNSASPASSNAHLERFEDGGSYVRVRAADLQGQYGSSSSHPVTSYQRDLVYLRSSTFVFFDRTTVASASADRWMAFHTPVAPTTVTVAADPGQRRFDVISGGVARGSLRLLLPQNPQIQTVALLGGITRIEAHVVGSAAQEWLSVVTVGAPAPGEKRLTSSNGNALGVEVQTAREQIVMFPTDQSSSATLTSLDYDVKAGVDADHVLVDMQPSASGYAITVQQSGAAQTISVKPGGSFQASPAGVLAFSVDASGVVAAISTTPPPGGGTGGSGGGGGTSGAGGTTGAGGSPAAGGTTSTGGSPGAGGTTSTGGSPGAGGTTSTGGSPGAGGTTSTGGSPGAGGTTSTGGSPGAGGTTSTGGGSGAGGATSTGGASGGTSGTGSSGASGASGDTGAGGSANAELPPCE